MLHQASLRLEFGRNVFKPYHHDRDVIVRVSMCSLLNQGLRCFLGILDGPYELTSRLVIQNVPYLRLMHTSDQKRYHSL